MKLAFTFLIAFFFVLAVSCNAQPRSTYEIYSDQVISAVSYQFFLETESSSQYRLQQNMDIFEVLDLKIGESPTPVFEIQLDNDGSEYAVGVVAVNSAGYYSGLGVSVGSVGSSPPVPGGVTFRKK